jgi:hypothetical protein
MTHVSMRLVSVARLADLAFGVHRLRANPHEPDFETWDGICKLVRVAADVVGPG